VTFWRWFRRHRTRTGRLAGAAAGDDPVVTNLDPVMVGAPLWTLLKDAHSAEARVRAIPDYGLELRFSTYLNAERVGLHESMKRFGTAPSLQSVANATPGSNRLLATPPLTLRRK
jgi:hypothetical protein